MNTKIILFLLSISAVLYMLIIFAFTAGWNSLRNYSFSHRHLHTPVSVIIPFRNESAGLRKILIALSHQNYPAELMEVIFVNDHSEDDGKIRIDQFISEKKPENFRVINNEKSGKKAALQTGVEMARGKLIVTTDADCLFTKDWLAEMVVLYEEKAPRLILGSVVYHYEKTFLQKLFSLDFMSLVASGAGSAGLGLPFMGNAANMAFEKQIYLDAETDALKTGFASGDDVFFIHYVKSRYGREAITFIKNRETIVYTPSPKNLSAFLSQRIRWGSKARGYTQPWAVLVSYSVFLFNFLLTAALVFGFFIHWFFIIYGLFIALKTLVDFPLLYAIGRFTGKRHLLPFVFPFETIYPLYITYVAFRGLLPFEWKNRKLAQ